MKTDKNQTPSMNDEPPAGSGTGQNHTRNASLPKKVKCNHWTDGGCQVAVCWHGERVNGQSEKAKAKNRDIP